MNPKEYFKTEHKSIKFERMMIGGRMIDIEAKTAENIRERRKTLARKNARITKELREARLIPNINGAGNKHAFCITPKYSVRGRDKTASETRQAIIHGETIARKMELENEWEKAKAEAFKI